MAFYPVSIKNILIAAFVLIILTNLGCGKSEHNDPKPVDVKNCDNLITDTTGTGDKALLVMPNAFTPNGDGNNDVYRPITKDIATINFSIYDINNNVVYNTTTLREGWTPAPAAANTSATYYYRIQATTAGNHQIGTCGSVHLITCLPKDSLRYLYFGDQLSPDYTFSLPTAENLPSCQ